MEPDISPLAKRLAEENNVNWRGLGGSGASGRIVERDVLEYLAKVMAGEEDLNPTAEPVPEGMEAWPEEDTAGYFSESSASPKASDTLTEVVTEMPSVSVGESSDMFAFDDEPSFDLEPDALEIDDAEAMFTDLDDSDDAIDDVASTFSQNQAEVSDVHISEDIFLFDDDLESAPEDDSVASFGEAETTAPDVSMDAIESEASLDMEPEVQSSFDAGSDVLADSDTSFETVESGFETEDSSSFTDVPTADSVETAFTDAGTPDFETEDVLDNADELFASAEDSSDDSALFSEDHGHEEASHDDTLLEPIAATIEPVATDALDTVTSSEDGIESETLTPVVSVPDSALPLSSFGIMLRRHTDLGAAMSAQLAISHELGHSEEPIALSRLLVRAAAKALQKVDIAHGQGVGVALFEEDGVRVASVANADTQSFRELVEQLSNLSASDAHAGLAVADMSDLGVDEAVLNLDVPVLALGRILQDSEQASQHSTLTLSGNVPVEAGTKFLSTVADLLASPIRLVL